MSGQELTVRARVKLGKEAETLPGFANALGLRGYDSAGSARLKRWLSGKGDPDYEGTICLLDAMGAINWDALTAEPERNNGQRGEILR